MLLLLLACFHKPAPPSVAFSPQGTWNEICPDTDPPKTALRLEPDGSFSFAYPTDPAFVAGDDETWTVEGDTLTVSWNDGFAVTRYDLRSFDGTQLKGVSSKACGDQVRLVRCDMASGDEPSQACR